jgi:hypothetical protein
VWVWWGGDREAALLYFSLPTTGPSSPEPPGCENPEKTSSEARISTGSKCVIRGEPWWEGRFPFSRYSCPDYQQPVPAMAYDDGLLRIIDDEVSVPSPAYLPAYRRDGLKEALA